MTTLFSRRHNLPPTLLPPPPPNTDPPPQPPPSYPQTPQPTGAQAAPGSSQVAYSATLRSGVDLADDSNTLAFTLVLDHTGPTGLLVEVYPFQVRGSTPESWPLPSGRGRRRDDARHLVFVTPYYSSLLW
jgi:hypothetical protein